MKNNFVIGAFYSKGTAYEKIAEKYLIPSCKKWNLKYSIIETENHGNWYRNVAEKANIIRHLLYELESDVCLVMLDADSTIEKYPQLFEEIPFEYDIAYHTLNWNTWYGYSKTPPVMELLTGTMFFRNNHRVKKLCKEWYDSAIKTKEWEQKVLQRIIKQHLQTTRVKAYDLPIQYCFMNSRPGNKPPLISEEGVIIKHYQMSRELKGRMK